MQEVCKRYLDEELKAKESKIVALQEDATVTSDRIATLEETAVEHEKEITSLKGQVEKQALDIDKKDKEIGEQQKISEEQKEKVCSFAEKKTKLGLVFKWYVFPVITVVLVLAYVLFVALQFIACDAEWNLSTKIVDIIGKTTFGKNTEGYIAIVDSALFIILTSIVIPNFFVKPWDKEKRNADKQKRIEKYIERNHLL